ncbi:DUF1207 domain-containing protein [Stieleria varia]|uniref:DUF1207 domain-containing protein n=1 Tax=Stieleria varia TaxID=2528005 RepID=UPI00313A92F4
MIHTPSSYTWAVELDEKWYPDQVEFADEFSSVFDDGQRMIDDVSAECDAICSRGGVHHSSPYSVSVHPTHPQKRGWEVLPDGLLWHSYLADPHEPRISMVITQNNNADFFWDATLGGRVGLLRYGTSGALDPKGWQWDLEGAVMTRLDLQHAEDVESMDYRFGTLITKSEGPWAMKFGYFHISSHVGDEFLVRNPTFTRINYVTESMILGASYKPVDAIRLYGEMANAFRASDGARRYQFQTGAEFTPAPNRPGKLMPFAAAHFNFRQAVDYDVSTSVQVGMGYLGPKSGRRLRFGLHYSDGPTSQYEFFTRRESIAGLGIWFDY